MGKKAEKQGVFEDEDMHVQASMVFGTFAENVNHYTEMIAAPGEDKYDVLMLDAGGVMKRWRDSLLFYSTSNGKKIVFDNESYRFLQGICACFSPVDKESPSWFYESCFRRATWCLGNHESFSVADWRSHIKELEKNGCGGVEIDDVGTFMEFPAYDWAEQTGSGSSSVISRVLANKHREFVSPGMKSWSPMQIKACEVSKFFPELKHFETAERAQDISGAANVVPEKGDALESAPAWRERI